MINKEKIDRINELYRKQKAAGLTDEEKNEQAQLRREYVDGVRNSLRQTLDSIKVMDQHLESCDCGEHDQHQH